MKRGALDHPKTLALRDRLGLDDLQVVGLLERLIHFAQKYAIQGDVGKWSDASIAENVRWVGDDRTPAALIAALLECGWLDHDSRHRLVIHDWADHADQSTKKTWANRKLEPIQPDGIPHSTRVDGKIPPERTEPSDPTPGKERRGEEGKGKDPESSSGSSSESDARAREARRPPLAAVRADREPGGFITYPDWDPQGFQRFRASYPRWEKHGEAVAAWDTLRPDAALQVEIAASIERLMRSPEWVREGGRFIPQPANFLHDQRWLDEVAVPQVSEATARTAAALENFVAGGKRR